MRTIIAAPPGFLATDEELAAATEIVEAAQNVFIGPDAPSTHPEKYAWFQTGLGAGEDITLWIEDGQ